MTINELADTARLCLGIVVIGITAVVAAGLYYCLRYIVVEARKLAGDE